MLVLRLGLKLSLYHVYICIDTGTNKKCKGIYMHCTYSALSEFYKLKQYEEKFSSSLGCRVSLFYIIAIENMLAIVGEWILKQS